MDDNYYMDIAYKEALKANKANDIPVGAVIVKDNKIIAKAHNKRDKKQVVTNHAEILAIIKANKRHRNWRLVNCTMYCTLEPCKMCMEVIKASKMSKVIYGAKQENQNIKYELKMEQTSNKEIINRTTNLLKNAFKKIRNVKKRKTIKLKNKKNNCTKKCK